MKILIIEDEPALLVTVKQFLEGEKDVVETANIFTNAGQDCMKVMVVTFI